MKSESILSLHRHHGSYHIQGPENYQEIDKIVHVTSGSIVILWSYENTFCGQKTKII